MEVNSSPGLEGIEKATSIDIAAKIMNYIDSSISPLPDNKKRRLKKDNIGA
jgi:ribosomal protein S6--L-glutamate ligase